MMQKCLAASLGLLVLAGCVVGPDHARPAPPPSRALETGTFLRGANLATQAPIARWWEGFNDPVLSGLIETALSQSPAVEAATARIRQARSGIASARAALLPILSASGTYIYADLPDQSFGAGGGATDFVTLGFDTQWEIDLWGGKAREFNRARAEAGAAQAGLADTLVSLSAEIARTYATLRARQASEKLLEARQTREERLVHIALERRLRGAASDQDVASARQRLSHTEAELGALKADIAGLHDALAILTGAAPGTLDDLPAAAIPLPPAQVAIGDPAAMLARRPDVMAAERRLEAATESIGIAKARRFPAVSLLGLIGIGGSGVDDLFDSSQLSAIGVPRLSWNFLDFGRSAAAVQGAQAARDEALADYRASVLAALQDAEASLARFGAARIALARAGESLSHARDIARLERLRASAGAISRAQSIEAEIREIDMQMSEINSRASLAVAYAALAKSLGLGWQVDSQPEN
ncbi:MAG: efflux transporter outer membrane subunit [Novosphingobium sp.]|nr:efflux transporter outer membrane subunit [Novosphingobium sp.]